MILPCRDSYGRSVGFGVPPLFSPGAHPHEALTGSQDAIGAAMAESDDPSFVAKAKKIKGLQTVVADQIVQWVTRPASYTNFGQSAVMLSGPFVV